MRMTGARAVIECLREENVEIVFGYPGGSVIPLYDALYETKFPHILPRHEQGAVHAADGYARATGKVGVCIATSGPGATNLITGIATAYMDSVPLVAITGQVSRFLLGKDSFQEADITGITTPITKHNYLVKDVQDLARVMKEAFYIARTGRPGPVVVDIAKNVFMEEIEFAYPSEVRLRGYQPVFEGEIKIIEQVAEEMAQAKKPLIFIGGGVNLAGVSEEIRNLVHHTGIPLITGLMGLGCMPDEDPLNYGMVGMHGTVAANIATTECDLLMGIGVRFDDRVTSVVRTFAPNARIVHFDIDAAEINKNVLAQVKVLGDLRWSVPALFAEAIKRPATEWQAPLQDWIEQLNKLRDENPLTYVQRENAIMPQEVIRSISDYTQGDCIVVTDVGQHQMWAAQFFQYRHPRAFLTSGGLGTMGFGLPAALGAQVGCPQEKVVVFSGDGGFMMNCQELATISDLGLPVKIFILNNQVLGMVAQWQRLFFNERYSHIHLKGNTDFVKLAEAMGVPGMRITERQEIQAAIEKAFSTEGPIVVEIRIPEDENVIPMVPAGGRLDEMILGEY